MTAEEVRERLASIPFTPFEFCLADGRALRVEHPDMLSFRDSNRILALCTNESEVEVIDLMLVLSLRFNEPDFTHIARREKAEGRL